MASNREDERSAKHARRNYDKLDSLRENEYREKSRGLDRDRERKRSRERQGQRRSRSTSPRRHRSREKDDRFKRHRRDDTDKDLHRTGREGSRDPGRGRDSDHRRRDNGENRKFSKKHDRKPLRIEGPLPSQDNAFAVSKGEEPEKPKEKPNYGTTGVLAAASNSVAQADGTSIALKYHEPPEARKPQPRDQWKLFIFKGSEIVDTIELSLRSCWLIGKERIVVDLQAEHPSVSKQHAVIQFRYIEKRNEFGDKIGKVKPYLIDLDSANGTILNDEKVPESRYLELRDKDMIQFGQSTREYVIMLAPKD